MYVCVLVQATVKSTIHRIVVKCGQNLFDS